MLLAKARRALLALALALCAVVVDSHAAGLGETWSALPKERKLLYVNLGMAAFITAYGVASWDYFQNSPRATSEGWFGLATSEGGADKLGHAYTSHMLANVLASRYAAWGYDDAHAGLYGALSAFGLQAFMEVGDSFSGQYGFSYEDFVANGLGSAFGYLYWRYPELSEKLDFRVEYRPTFEDADVFTDYEHHKYLLALKLGGFERFNRGPLQYLELHAGYYTRGYDDFPTANNRRSFYFGIGINLSQIARKADMRKLATFFNFYQTPYTYVAAKHRFDD